MPWVNLEWNPEIRVTTGEEHRVSGHSLDEVYFPCRDTRAIPSSHSQLEWRLDFPGATQEAP